MNVLSRHLCPEIRSSIFRYGDHRGRVSLGTNLGIGAVATFVRELSETDIILEPPAPEDYLRSSDILRKYNDNNIDFVDACIVAMAERLNITKILTVDHGIFGSSPEHCESFELIPEAL